MWTKVGTSFGKGTKSRVCLFFGVGFFLFNILASMHAYRMTHYDGEDGRDKGLEELSLMQKAKVLLMGIRVPRPENKVTPDQSGLAFQVYPVKRENGPILEAWYVPSPEPRGVVLMFHGYASSKASLLPEAKVFHAMNFAAFLVDFRGCGGSQGNTTSVGYHEAEDVALAVEFARALSLPRPLLLFGRSMGSAAILRAIQRYGIDSDGVILECPFDSLLSTVKNRFAVSGIPAFPGAWLLVFWGGVQQGFNGFGFTPSKYAQAVRSPALILQGKNDTRVTLAQAELVFANLTGTKQLVVFEGAAHEPYLRRDALQWQEKVSRFLQLLVQTPRHQG